MKLLVAYMRKLKLNHATAINGLEALNTYKEANGCFDVVFMGKYPLQPYILSSGQISDGSLLQTYQCRSWMA
jgi:hypothetical protein